VTGSHRDLLEGGVDGTGGDLDAINGGAGKFDLRCRLRPSAGGWPEHAQTGDTRTGAGEFQAEATGLAHLERGARAFTDKCCAVQGEARAEHVGIGARRHTDRHIGARGSDECRFERGAVVADAVPLGAEVPHVDDPGQVLAERSRRRGAVRRDQKTASVAAVGDLGKAEGRRLAGAVKAEHLVRAPACRGQAEVQVSLHRKPAQAAAVLLSVFLDQHHDPVELGIDRGRAEGPAVGEICLPDTFGPAEKGDRRAGAGWHGEADLAAGLLAEPHDRKADGRAPVRVDQQVVIVQDEEREGEVGSAAVAHVLDARLRVAAEGAGHRHGASFARGMKASGSEIEEGTALRTPAQRSKATPRRAPDEVEEVALLGTVGIAVDLADARAGALLPRLVGRLVLFDQAPQHRLSGSAAADARGRRPGALCGELPAQSLLLLTPHLLILDLNGPDLLVALSADGARLTLRSLLREREIQADCGQAA
jgi:hypothetical protein